MKNSLDSIEEKFFKWLTERRCYKNRRTAMNIVYKTREIKKITGCEVLDFKAFISLKNILCSGQLDNKNRSSRSQLVQAMDLYLDFLNTLKQPDSLEERIHSEDFVTRPISRLKIQEERKLLEERLAKLDEWEQMWIIYETYSTGKNK